MGFMDRQIFDRLKFSKFQKSKRHKDLCVISQAIAAEFIQFCLI